MVKNKADLARQLGVDRAVVRRHELRGMPTHSLAEAQAWRDANLSVAHRKDLNPARAASRPQASAVAICSPEVRRFLAADFSDELEHLERLMVDGARALEAGLIEYVAENVRAAIRAVPPSWRRRAKVNQAVMDALTASKFSAMSVCESQDAAERQRTGEQMSDEEAVAMGDFWFRVAADEP